MLNIIRSSMDSGKSVSTRDFIVEDAKELVIVFTARIQQSETAHALLGPLGFKLYNADHRRADGTKQDPLGRDRPCDCPVRVGPNQLMSHLEGL